MNHELIQNAEQYNKRHRRKKLWQKVVSVLGCIVVFCTTYALILPAITQEREVFCGLEEHKHDDSCYTRVTGAEETILDCSLEALGVHTHGAECYDGNGVVLCGQADYVVHTHDALCLNAGGSLVCTIPEASQHIHGEACYTIEGGHTHDESCYTYHKGERICQLPEEEGHAHGEACYGPGQTLLCTTAENHIHGEACYTVGGLTCAIAENHTHGQECWQSALVCQLPEDETHSHGEDCYSAVLNCSVPEGHVHAESCYSRSLICAETEGHIHSGSCYDQVLQCELAESEGHAHTDPCYEQVPELTCTQEEVPGEQVLVCTEPEALVHVHSGACFRAVTEDTLTCTMPENEEHTHSKICYGTWELTCELEAHEHDETCYIDLTADLETAADWERTFAHVELTGNWNEDVLAIAKTQLGYTESTANYAIWEDGTTHGYTRYGAWYGVPYGDWCGMFVSFCLHYAGVEGMPLNYGVRPWIEDLTVLELYHIAEEYDPQPGDLVFFDWEGDDLSDHVGIVAEIIEATETEPAQIKTIEGNSSNCVQYVTYDRDDPVLLGYSELPEKPEEEEPETEYFCGLEEHAHSEDCYGEDGALVCTLTEHTHTEECLTALVTYYCGLEEHTHGEDCYDEEGSLICTLTEHTHTEECETEPVTYYCGFEEHAHSEECYDEQGALICELEEHTHTILCQADLSALSEEDRARVEHVILLIDAMPSADEIDAKIAEFEEAEDYEGEEAWLTEVYQQVGNVYLAYRELGDNLQTYVVNADKLLELEYIWSMQPLAVTTNKPTIYQINSYDRSDGNFDGDSDAAVMIHGDGTKTVQDILDVPSTWQFWYWYAVFVDSVEENNNDYLKVTRIIEPGSNKLTYSPPANGYILLFYSGVVIPDAEVGDYVTVNFTVPEIGVEKADGYGTVEFSGSLPINSAAPTTTWYTSTKDFVELNLYDYNGYVNSNYWATTNWYPGFQWNGGAYSNDSGDGDPNDYRYYYSYTGIGIPNAVTDRNRIDSIDFGNSLITNLTYGYGNYGSYTKAVNATNVGKTSAYYTSTGPINWLYGNSTEGWTNKPIGVSTTDASYTDVMKRTLVGGYPALSNGTMLDYLFKEGTAVDKLNTSSIDGLFQKDEESGEYQYNSRLNHAQYTNNFFQLYNQIITPNFITYPFGNFLPLNTISDSSKATQVGAFNYAGGMQDYVERIIDDLNNDTEGLGTYWNATQSQLATMLLEYKENWSLYSRTINGISNSWTNLSPANAIRDYFWGDTSGAGDKPSNLTGFITQDFLNRMYNIDWDVQTNFFFGMEMKMTFMQPKGGMTGNDTNGDGESDYPMVFYFTGDDDVWVYIDEVLFLDLSGIHRHVGGEIDFVNGKVHYYHLDTANTGDVSTTPYATYTFAELLNAAGKSTAGLNSNGTFTDYTTHTFNFYYMERGSGSSVCRLNFNFPLLKKNSITVTKENVTVDENNNPADTTVLGNPDYYFNIVNSSNELFVGPNSVTGINEYTILDSAGNKIGTGKTDEYGIFTLKAGQTAVFEGISENEGKYFIQELIKAEDNDQYPTVYINDQLTRYNDLVDWSYRKYFYPGERTEAVYVGPYGYQWYGRSGYDTDASTQSSFYFEQQNHVNVSTLGSLSVTKKLERYTAPLAETTYKMYITLDGVPLPIGMEYTVGGETRTVTETGYIEIAAEETALIQNIISGTEFTVKEDSGSAEGYEVIYSHVDGDEVEKSQEKGITGVVRVNTAVSVVVTNSEKGAQVVIPGSKTLSASDGESRSFSFVMTQVTNKTGAETVSDLKQTVATESSADNWDFSFSIAYLSPEIEVLPATFYYRITEESAADTLTNNTVYIAEITVTESESGEDIDAELTNMWVGTMLDGIPTGLMECTAKSADFVNTLIGSLTLTKEVTGTTDYSGEFTFTITLAPGTSGVDPLATSYPMTYYRQDNTTEKTTVTLNENNQIVLTGFKHGEKAAIEGIPYGATWKVTEDSQGYKASYTLNGEKTDGVTSSGDITTGDTTVAYTNAVYYELPDTGGTGTYVYTMAGLLLLLISTALVMYRAKKSRREVI